MEIHLLVGLVVLLSDCRIYFRFPDAFRPGLKGFFLYLSWILSLEGRFS